MTQETTKQAADSLLQSQRELMAVVLEDGAGRKRSFIAGGLKEVTDRPKRNHAFLNLDSLLAFALKDCTPDKAAVFYNDKAVKLVCDRFLMEDACAFDIKTGIDLGRWLVNFKQKELIQHLQAWGHAQIADGSVDLDSALLALHGLSLSKTVTYNNVQMDGRTVQLNYTLDGGDPKSAKLPIDWQICVSIHEGGPVFTVPLRLELTMPDNERDTPTFRFTCIILDALKDQSLDAIGARIQQDLGGWLVLKATI